MADDTNKDVAATATDDGSITPVTDAALDQAAMDAVAKQTDTPIDGASIVSEVDTTGTVDSDSVEETSELDADGLPVDHTDRSNLGRKITAFHRRQDEFESRIDRLLGVIEGQQQPTQAEELVLEPNEPVTFAEMTSFLDQREKIATQKADTYKTGYMKTLGNLSSNVSEQEWNAISEEMKNITYDPSSDPIRDAETNFYRAERAYLRKQLAGPKNEKVNPLKGNSPRSALGAATNQTTVTKDVVLPKLDKAGQSYLAYVGREDGAERATSLHRGLAEKE